MNERTAEKERRSNMNKGFSLCVSLCLASLFCSALLCPTLRGTKTGSHLNFLCHFSEGKDEEFRYLRIEWNSPLSTTDDEDDISL